MSKLNKTIRFIIKVIEAFCNRSFSQFVNSSKGFGKSLQIDNITNLMLLEFSIYWWYLTLCEAVNKLVISYEVKFSDEYFNFFLVFLASCTRRTRTHFFLKFRCMNMQTLISSAYVFDYYCIYLNDSHLLNLLCITKKKRWED